MSGPFRINTPQVINEVIDGEAVIINLGSGDYFSLRGSGSYIWQAIDAGADAVTIVDAFVAADLGSRDVVAPAITALLEQLVVEGLVVPAEPGEGRVALAAPGGSSFDPPALEKFTDMQDLILLDPVHEVDERGWPHAAPKP
jgi:hypothetical protein